jgi:tetratricopeptide (TPR) repeat protein
MMLKRMVWVASALCLFAGISLAQITSIRGEVVGEDGKPLQGAQIKIERLDIRGHYVCKTNKKGEYYYGGLPLGQYSVSVLVNGRAADEVKLRTTFGEPTIVNFDLKQARARQAALMKAAETGQLTDEQARGLSAEQRAAIEEQAKQRQQQIAKGNALNEAFNAGMQAEQAKQYDVAVESFKKAAEVDPKQDVVWAHLGEVSLQLAMQKTGAERDALITQGIDAWNKAMGLKPEEAGYHNNFALALARVGRFPEAQAELQKAATLDPAHGGRYYFNLGALLVNSGRNDEAAEAFKKAVELSPDYADAHYQYGVCLMSKAKTEADGRIVPPPGTKEEFEAYLKLAPNGPNAAAAQGMIQAIDSQIQTTYSTPTAPKKGKKK